MNELYYFTPFVFVMESEDKLIIQTGVNFKLEVKYDKNLVSKIKENNGITFPELLMWFSEQQIVALFQNNILLEEKLNDTERYSRTNGYFITSKNNAASRQLMTKKVLVLGAGAIGSHVAWMLTTLGIKRLAISDFDVVEESNLNRQLLYDESDIGKSKAEALKRHLQVINSELQIEAYTDKIVSKEQLYNYVKQGFDFVVRAIDTPFESVGWLNEVCVELKVPYTSGGFLEYFGVVGPTYIPGITPCYSCYKNEEVRQERVYGTGPTIAMLTEDVASKVVFEVASVLTRKRSTYVGRMEIYDSVHNTSRYEIFEQNDECPICKRHRGREKNQRDSFAWSVAYFFCLGILGFLVSTEGWQGYGTILSIVLISALTLLFNQDAMAFKLAFMGGTFYGILSFALTLRVNGGAVNTGEYLATQIVGLGLQMLITVSVAIVLFVGITYIYRGIFGFIENYRMEKRNVRYGDR